MPGHLLHENAEVQCLHSPGQAQPGQTDLGVKVSGQKLVTRLVLYNISGCSLPPPPAGNGPCVTANWTSAATRVKANGQPVLLTDSQALCAPSGTGVKIVSTQTRVKGE
jgi:hypothetical protein